MNKEKIVEPFTSTVKQLNELHYRYFHAYSSFFIFETMKKLCSPPHAGKIKVEEYVKTINRFRSFFLTSQEANRCYFFIELAKFFDPNRKKQSLTINSLIEKIEKEISQFSLEKFVEYKKSQDRYIRGMEESFKGIKNSDLNFFKKKLESIKSSTDFLWEYRSQWLAHDDIDKDNYPIARNEIIKIFSVLGKILEKLSSKLDSSTWQFNPAIKECKNQTKKVIQSLNNYHKIELKKFKQKYKIK